MNKENVANAAVRSVLLTGAAVAAAGYALPASAANADTPANLGKVTVTGTRIKRTDVETAQPITRISRQQIERSGYTSVGKLLGRLSFAGAHSTPQSFGLTSTINLRNLVLRRPYNGLYAEPICVRGKALARRCSRYYSKCEQRRPRAQNGPPSGSHWARPLRRCAALTEWRLCLRRRALR